MTQLAFDGLASPRDLIVGNHYTRNWPSGKSHTYVHEDAIVVFSIPANLNISKWLGCRTWEFSRLWAPDGHRPNLLTEAISVAVGRFKALGVADVVISYADPSAGHTGGVYRAASWVYLGRSDENRSYRDGSGRIIPRRSFHAGTKFLRKAEILALGYEEVLMPGKLRFARSLTKVGKRAVSVRAVVWTGA